MGSLAVGMRDASGQMYMRNRYYDPQTGQFTQPDPIGLAGGMNVYGFAAGDPVSYADPYGLSPEDVIIACRNVNNTGRMGGHCAIRVTNTKRNINVTYELLNVSGIGNPQSAGKATPAAAAEYAGRGVRVEVPEGMSSDAFDLQVIATAERLSKERDGKDYSMLGDKNSNRFVYDVINQSGGDVPWAAVPYFRVTPGICGGNGLSHGTDCSGSRYDGTYLPRED
jgi:RHS repeat-associated protein